MVAAAHITAPAGAWTKYDPTGPVSVRVQNLSTSVPIRIAILANDAEPDANQPYIVLGADVRGTYVEELDVGDGEALFFRPNDHSGLAAIVAVMPVSSLEP